MCLANFKGFGLIRDYLDVFLLKLRHSTAIIKEGKEITRKLDIIIIEISTSTNRQGARVYTCYVIHHHIIEATVEELKTATSWTVITQFTE